MKESYVSDSTLAYSRVEFRLINPMSIRTIFCKLSFPGWI